MTTHHPNALPQCWQDYALALQAGIDRIVLFGAPGVGKTYGALTIGGAGGADVRAERMVCTEEMTTLDITGGYLPNNDGGVSFVEGAALRAWRNGSRLIIDEGDRAGGDVLATLLAMTDTVASASFTRPDTGEVVRPANGFSAIITSNIAHPDDLPQALRDRFPVAICIDAPHPDALAALPAYVRDVAAAMVSSTDPDRRASLRAFMAFAKLREAVAETDALRLAFGERSELVADALRMHAITSGAE
jgi:hypothetical protein